MRVLLALAAAALAFTLASCGDAGDSPAPADTPAPTVAAPTTTEPEPTRPEPEPAQAETVDSLAGKLGCTSLQPADKLFTEAAGFCQLPNGSQVEIAVFASNEARDQYLDLGQQAMPNAAFVKGDQWSAGGPNCTQEDLAPLA